MGAENKLPRWPLPDHRLVHVGQGPRRGGVHPRAHPHREVNEPLPAERTLIVVHDTMWRRPLELPERLPDGCEITTDRGRLEDADAVVFHVPGLRFYHRPRKRPNQLWIAWSIESDANYPRLRDPAFMARFDLTMTYRRDADVIWGYVPYYSSADNLERALLAPPRPKDSEHPVAMLISSRVDRSGRRAYARELARHIAVDSYGRFLRNKELPDATGRASKLELIGHYPFPIAFENSIGAPTTASRRDGDSLVEIRLTRRSDLGLRRGSTAWHEARANAVHPVPSWNDVDPTDRRCRGRRRQELPGSH